MSDSLRLDAAMVLRGLAGGRDKAKNYILQGTVTVNGTVVKKPAFVVRDTDRIECTVCEQFVGRGGEKLKKVLDQTALSVNAAICVDIGASTGGFTDCLLQYGAAKVFAVDVGHDQLVDSLKNDPRVVSLEGVDIRRHDVIVTHIPDHSADLCTADVSFISLTAVWEAVSSLLKEDGHAVCLIKPQFEAGRAALSKRGVVRSAKDHVRVISDLLAFWQAEGFVCTYISYSPIKGGEGNIEYVAVLTRRGVPTTEAVSDIVAKAFETL